jgi:hypothetical protein
MKNIITIFGACCALVLIIISFDKTSPKYEPPATTENETDPRTTTIQLGKTMIGSLVKPGQTLIHVIQSPPEDGGEICFAYFDSAIGSEYVLWNPNTQRTIVYHSNGLVETIPSGRTDTWDEGFPPQYCKAGRDDNFRKIVRTDLLNPSTQKVQPLPKNSR